MKNLKCLLVSMTGVTPFNRCQYCERRVQECFGLQFFVITASIIGLLMTTLFITDIPALVLDVMITIILLIALLSYLASKETNEIILNNTFLTGLNKELEEKVLSRTEELQRSNEELIKANRMKNEFIGIINHELKTPITAVISGIEVIKAHGTTKLNESQNRLLNIMDDSGKEMLRLTNNLLDLSKIEAGKIVIYPEHIPIINLIEEIILALKPMVDSKNIKVISNIDASIKTIYGDPERLKQAVFNIVDNAVKYTPDKGTIKIMATVLKDKVKIEVQDSGLGIKKEDLSAIFDKFAKRAPGHKGTGLGLYISKSLLEAHNGGIEVESEYGKGSIFKLYLPRTQPA